MLIPATRLSIQASSMKPFRRIAHHSAAAASQSLSGLLFMASAVQVLKEQGAIHPDSRNIQSGPGHPYAKVTHLAQDRTGWQAWVNRWYENQGWWNYATVAQEGGGGGAGRPPSPARTRSRL